jgi:cytoskeletal protein RodZ
MSDFNWCHGPQCHEKHTVDRVRGVKGSKVLRTRKIKLNQWNSSGQWGFFCSNHCQNDFWKTYATQIVAIAPRTEALETPINVTKEVHESTYWGRQINTKIEVDETRSTDIG